MGVLEFYNEFYMKAEFSMAHAVFCEKVYGKNLCQHGMADMYQLKVLLKLLGLKSTSRLLDLGCGIGLVTEYIQDHSGSNVTGMDFSPIAIEKAKSRTNKKANKLKFEIGDMNNLQYEADSFDAIISIDTHYFVNNFEKLLDQSLDIIVKGGQFCVFSDQGTGIPRDDSFLQPEESKIGQLLKNKRIEYNAINLTEMNKKHWKLKEKVIKEQRDEFEKEGNLFLYENRLEECIRSNRDLDCRFLFQIKKE